MDSRLPFSSWTTTPGSNSPVRRLSLTVPDSVKDGAGGGGGAGAGVVDGDGAVPASPHPTAPIKAGSPDTNAMRICFRIICLVP